MLIVAGTLEFDASKTEEAKAAAAAMMAATQEESGCIEYAFSIDMADPAKIHIFEAWESQEALDAHFATPHMAAFGAATADLGFSNMSILKHEVSATDRLR